MVSMKIKLTSVPVLDQAKARDFYVNVLGFVVKNDIPMGDVSWLTVVSLEGPDDLELLLEPMGFEPAKGYQKALHDAGIPWTALASDDLRAEYEKLKAKGVVFQSEPQEMDTAIYVAFEDTCGNWIQMYQTK